MSPEWEKPVKAVLDYFRLDAVTVMGFSLGGGLAIRAGDEGAVNTLVARAMAQSLLLEWTIQMGLHNTGLKTPYEMLKHYQKIRDCRHLAPVDAGRAPDGGS